MTATISLLLDQLGLGRYGTIANAFECVALCAVAVVIVRSSGRPTSTTPPPTAVAAVIAEAEAVIAPVPDPQHAGA